LGFEGKGYSDAFVENFRKTAAELRETGEAGNQVRIRVVGNSDEICGPCVNREGESCTSEPKIKSLDEAHARVLGIKLGDELSWGEAKKLIAEKMSLEDFHKACAPCSWKALGLCEAALKNLKAKKSEQKSS
jgi:hypothetical protein